jgi:hypothetical protein
MLVLIGIDVSSQVSSCIPPRDQMAHVSHQGQSNTQSSIVAFCAMSLRSHHDFMYLPCSIVQEIIISTRTDDRFSLEVLTPIRVAVLDIGI